MALALHPGQIPSDSVAMDIERKSGLAGPTMLLEGHEGQVFSLEFSPDGKNLASSGFEKTISVWNVYGEPENWCVLKGHTNAVLQVKWSQTEPGHLYSCSADKSVAVWDVEEGKRLKKLGGHSAIVNSMDTVRRGLPLIVSGADDGTVKLWDLRARKCVKTFEHSYQILSVAFDDTAERVFAGTLDNQVLSLDMRTFDISDSLSPEHGDSVTGLAVSHDGAFLLSNSMDQSVRLWDIRPHCASGRRLLHEFKGATHNFEKNLLRVAWSKDDQYFSAGSADRMLNVWDVRSRECVWRLPGHQGSINDVAFHPEEACVIASGGSDKRIFMGELA